MMQEIHHTSSLFSFSSFPPTCWPYSSHVSYWLFPEDTGLLPLGLVGHSHHLQCFWLRSLTHLPPSRLFKSHFPREAYPVCSLTWKPCFSLTTISTHHILGNFHSMHYWLMYHIIYIGSCFPLQLEDRLHRFNNLPLLSLEEAQQNSRVNQNWVRLQLLWLDILAG